MFALRAILPPARRLSFGDFLLNAQGEDVVAGIRTPTALERAKETDAAGL